MKKEECLFGKGFIYNFFLFCQHIGRNSLKLEGLDDSEVNNFLVISGARDHLRELEIPKCFHKRKFIKLLKELDNLCFTNNLSISDEDMERIEEVTKLIGIEVDKYLGVIDTRGEYE